MSTGVALARYRVTLEAIEPLSLPAYLGSTLRGAFGLAFRRLCCPGGDDEPCPVPDSCPQRRLPTRRTTRPAAPSSWI